MARQITDAMRNSLTQLHSLESDLRNLQISEGNIRSCAGADVTGCLVNQAACRQEIAALRARLLPDLTRALDEDVTEALAQLLLHLEAAAKVSADLKALEGFADSLSSVSGRKQIPKLHWHELNRGEDSRYEVWLRDIPERLRPGQTTTMEHGD